MLLSLICNFVVTGQNELKFANDTPQSVPYKLQSMFALFIVLTHVPGECKQTPPSETCDVQQGHTSAFN